MKTAATNKRAAPPTAAQNGKVEDGAQVELPSTAKAEGGELKAMRQELDGLKKSLDGIGQAAVQQVAGLYQTHHRDQLIEIRKRADSIVERLDKIDPFYRQLAPHAGLFASIVQIVQDDQGNSLSLLDVLNRIVTERKAIDASRVECARVLAEVKAVKAEMIAALKAPAPAPEPEDDGPEL